MSGLSRLIVVLCLALLSTRARAEDLENLLSRPIERIQFRGNTKVEAAAVARILRERIGSRETCPVCEARDPTSGATRKIGCVRPSHVDEPLDLCTVREDIKAIWCMGS